MRVALYARVSTEEQRERQTIDAQVEYARLRAAAEQWDLRLFLDDGVSGTLPLNLRPQGAKLMNAAAAGEIDMVVLHRFDRLGRLSKVILGALDKFTALNVPVKSLTEPFDTGTPIGMFVTQLLAGLAELDRATFLERSRVGTDRVARQPNRWLGGIVPFGYRKSANQTLSVDERPLPGLTASQADVVRDIFRLYTEDGLSTQRIADALNGRGIPTTYGRDSREVMAGEIYGTRATEGKRRRKTAERWTPSAIGRVLKNETYAGRHVYGRRSSNPGRELITREMPPIVSAALFQRAQHQLKANLIWGKAHPAHEYPLRGLLRCECGYFLIGQSYRGKGSAKTFVYRCHSHPTGKACRVLEDQAVAVLWADVEGFLQRPAEVLRVVASRTLGASQREDEAESKLLRLAADLRDVERRETRALDAHLRDLVAPDVLGRSLAALKVERAEIEAKMTDVRAARTSAATAAGETTALKAVLRSLARRAGNANPATKAAILRQLVKRTRVSWAGKDTRLEVVYAFPPAPVGAIPTTDRGSSPRRG